MATKRLSSIDLLRGVIMVLMAIDHVRVYSGIPAGGADPGVFFTRWVTHFCVSGFVVLAGTSAFLYGQTVERKVLSRFLLSRGLWLVVLEMTVIRFCWSFNVHLMDFMLAGVIWMLGWCMVLMAVLIWLPFRVIWITGLVLVAFQQVFKLAPAGWGWWNFIYTISEDAPFGISVLYVIVPWIGVMMVGYGFGALFQMSAELRDRWCRWIGGAAIGLFLVVGSIFALERPGPQPFFYRLLGQQKYPASQLYLLMTLGPMIALVPYAERAKGWLARVFVVYGRVPLFYYLLHILLIHSAALLVNWLRVGETLQGRYLTAPFTGLPEELRWGLPLLYLVFILVEVVLYFLCRWYGPYKSKALFKNTLNMIIRRFRGLFRPTAGQNRRKLASRGLSSHFHIREAAAEDVPRLAELHVQSWNETYGVVTRGPSVEIRTAQWEAIFQTGKEGWFCLLAENERGEAVGFVKAQRYAHEDLPEYRGELNKLYVLRDYQRLGIGRMLMYEAARRLIEMGIDNMVLFGIPQNPSGGFYEAMGGERLYAANGEFHGGYGWKDIKVLL